MPLEVVLGLLGVTLAVGVIGLWQWASGTMEGAAVAERSGLSAAPPVLERARAALTQRLMTTGRGRRLAIRLEASGAGIDAVTFVAGATAAGVLGFLAADYVMPKVLALLAAAGAVRGAFGWIEYKAGKRKEAFVGQLPELARVLANASSAGLATRSAIELAGEEMEDPAGAEMARVAEEMALGESPEDSLERLEERIPSRDVGVLVSTLAIQQRSGGDLVRALSDISETLDARRDLHREVKTLMAGSLATGYIVAAMGVGAILLLNLIDPGLFEAMTSTWTGRIALLISGALYAASFVLIQRVTRIEI